MSFLPSSDLAELCTLNIDTYIENRLGIMLKVEYHGKGGANDRGESNCDSNRNRDYVAVLQTVPGCHFGRQLILSAEIIEFPSDLVLSYENFFKV